MINEGIGGNCHHRARGRGPRCAQEQGSGELPARTGSSRPPPKGPDRGRGTKFPSKSGGAVHRFPTPAESALWVAITIYGVLGSSSIHYLVFHSRNPARVSDRHEPTARAGMAGSAIRADRCLGGTIRANGRGVGDGRAFDRTPRPVSNGGNAAGVLSELAPAITGITDHAAASPRKRPITSRVFAPGSILGTRQVAPRRLDAGASDGETGRDDGAGDDSRLPTNR